MAEPWDELKDGVLGALRESVTSFSGQLKDSIQPFLRDQAVVIAKEKWRALHAASDAEREIAEGNLRHLRGQIASEVARLQIAATREAGALLEKTLDVAINVLLRIGPKILGL